MSLAFDTPWGLRRSTAPHVEAASETRARVFPAMAVAQGVLCASIWLLSRGYAGIVHDARIYVGRALADLDPGGLGRDLLFASDGQTKLTLFSVMIRPLVRWLGPSQASMTLGFAAVALWFAAAAWLASRLAPRRLVPAALICAAVVPAYYGPFYIFSFGESFATPRGFAEAAVLAALAALFDCRARLAFALLGVGALFHPAMALAGAGVVFLVLAIRDVRWWGLGGAALCGGLALALAGVGPLRTLFQTFDPAWLAVMRVRNPFLFESLWPLSAWSDMAVSSATLLLAGSLATGRARLAFLSTAAVALAGTAAGYFLGELTSSELVLQLQLWRVLWLAKVVAVLSLPFCAARLWERRRRDARLTLALLACAWVGLESFPLAVPASAAMLAVWARSWRAEADTVGSRVLGFGIACASVLAVAQVGIGGSALFVSRAAIHAVGLVRLALLAGVLTAPVAGAAIALSIKPGLVPESFRLPLLAMLAATLAPLATVTWDQRTPTRAMTDAGEGRAVLDRLIGAAPNGVYWIGDDVAPWFWTRSPSWENTLQGTVAAFSRPLALSWDARSRAVAASAVGTPLDREPWSARTRPKVFPPELKPAPVLREGVLELCRTPDGPSAVVAPQDLTALFAPGQASLWRPPRADVAALAWKGRVSVVPRDAYTVVRCTAELRAADPPRLRGPI